MNDDTRDAYIMHKWRLLQAILDEIEGSLCALDHDGDTGNA